jgi:hypothetical protein
MAIEYPRMKTGQKHTVRTTPSFENNMIDPLLALVVVLVAIFSGRLS